MAGVEDDESDVSDAEIDEHDSLDDTDHEDEGGAQGAAEQEPGSWGVIRQHQKLEYDKDDDDDSSEGRHSTIRSVY